MSQDLVDPIIRRFSLAEYRELVIAVGGYANARRIIRGECVVELKLNTSSLPVVAPRILSGLLQQMGEEIHLPAINWFSVGQNFREGLDDDLPISVLTEGFQNHCLYITETDVPAMSVTQWRVVGEVSCDSGILAVFNTNPEKLLKEKKVIAFAHIRHFLITADQTEHYVFYVKDNNENFWAITAHMFARGWSIGIRPYYYPQEIRKGTVIVFPSADS